MSETACHEHACIGCGDKWTEPSEIPCPNPYREYCMVCITEGTRNDQP